MLEQNKGLFDEFRKIHNKYELDPEKYQDEFNLVGQAINDLIRKYENKVCGKSERSVYSKFSSSLADKFRAEVRKVFPKIDFIGIRISASTSITSHRSSDTMSERRGNEIPFEIKRIKL
ncbi:MAG: hypothetical protein A3D24_03490 [Candidatus Blackburnbacteria bacterium RIFCSPHIGHO2_02_FULL_39_13]|uniref:Uncharacterized protein n=1 Tax=Candidatus Blackburnbacteria bacterium RIFCSPLOWO2_01_FULL_40_20 TaxID=1797519 RepID=A0A1G1VDF8_9BACT|nr:MAG: hypothetical protein A2694_02170 [Candidatus Blackburnbacteria bacterium RIFCSPHIGHO2_01_FULL_40_17]OGY08155.1 MAG: hypothetical protein A3D24_03490 [Candidatus Blackburnbacteria bacterium RIFCSPHIGHO2_02_FULL_39_13]OGY13425.1 MAG: hypothetical protein A3A77_04620 [Candidatus Blackburnbacteria bacterium RIFCSPLOWO2_01_FULL_40_20]OGY14680.1 MAG: hypothetical protein A3I52_02140 [Candidatus Blackburnbacteria bacterium RIFCSPLOWO2_02_FULL_40_10]HBL52451.1 hypothetical protein [Candidatus B